MEHARPQLDPSNRVFTQRLSSTRRGARLARLLSVLELRSWGVPQDLAERAELVVAELATNAVRHGRLPGRRFSQDFGLLLALDPATGQLRVEVTDARGDVPPRIPSVNPEPDGLDPCGWGLLLVAALADRWDVLPHPPGGKTVRAVLSAPVTRG